MSADDEHILAKVRAVKRSPQHIGVLSTGERCAAALLLNKKSALPPGYTFMDAVDRLGPDWLEACLRINRTREFG